MSQPRPGKPLLTVCPECKLAFAPEKNPDGCPYCRNNPNLGRIARERQQEDLARQGTIGPKIRNWFANSTVRWGGIALGVMMAGLTLWLWSRSTESLGMGTAESRRRLIGMECARTGFEPGTPEHDACVREVEQMCGGIPPQGLVDCAREQTTTRYREYVVPPGVPAPPADQ